MFEKTKAFCDSFLELGVPCFDLLVYKDGKPLLRHMGGYRDLEAKLPVTANERRWIYSCTKPITVTAAMQLWEQKRFSLDDLLSDYLPAFRDMTVQTPEGIVPAKTPIRIENLFTMTAGFSYNYRSPKLLELRSHTPNPTTRQVIDALAQEPLFFEPGDRYQYSLCHDVLGALIEALSGLPLETYIRKHIFEPLGMQDSTFLLSEDEFSTMSPLYRFDKETGHANRLPATPDRVGTNYVSGGGGCVTTTEDYMKFAEAMRTGETLLKRDTISLMATHWLTPHQKRTFPLKTLGYGLGIWTPMPGQLRQDFGWGGAGGALLAVDVSRGLSIVYSQHMLSSPNQGMRSRMVATLLEELEGVSAAKANTEAEKNYQLTY